MDLGSQATHLVQKLPLPSLAAPVGATPRAHQNRYPRSARLTQDSSQDRHPCSICRRASVRPRISGSPSSAVPANSAIPAGSSPEPFARGLTICLDHEVRHLPCCMTQEERQHYVVEPTALPYLLISGPHSANLFLNFVICALYATSTGARPLRCVQCHGLVTSASVATASPES